MSAIEFRRYELYCDALDCHEEFRGKIAEARAAVRRRAVKAGWTHARSSYGYRHDMDFCPAHNPPGAS